MPPGTSERPCEVIPLILLNTPVVVRATADMHLQSCIEQDKQSKTQMQNENSYKEHEDADDKVIRMINAAVGAPDGTPKATPLKGAL